MNSALFATVLSLLIGAPESDWPAFRGQGDSQTTLRQLPLEWSAERGIAWEVELEGYGQSSPVVWGDAAFVTSVLGKSKEQLCVSCVSLQRGALAWTQKLPASRTVEVSDYVSRGAPTPMVDADRVYAFFESGDLVAFDHLGKEQWRRSLAVDYGEYRGNHGLGSSLAGTHDAVIVLVEHEGPSYLLALNKATGKTIWKVERPAKVSWTSPVVVAGPQGPEIIVGSAGSVTCYRAKDGEKIWWLSGLEGNTVPSPTIGEKLVIVGSTDVASNVAIERGQAGELSAEQIAWRSKEASSSFASPLICQGRVYFVNRAGAAFCLDEATGKKLWTQRLPESCWASPLGAEGRIYFFGKTGITTVVKAASTFEKLAENKLEIAGRVYGVAPVAGALLLRTGKKLICVGNP